MSPTTGASISSSTTISFSSASMTGNIDIQYVRTGDQLGDIQMKALRHAHFQELCDRIGIVRVLNK